MKDYNKDNEQLVSLRAAPANLGDLPESSVHKYEKPVLIAYGDVRDITLGPTPGLGESGCECARRDGPTTACPVVCPPGF